MDDEVDEDEQASENTDGDNEKVSEGFNLNDWLTLLKEVSDMTKMPWDKCWNLGIYEFFNYLVFVRDWNEKQRRLQEEYKRKLRK